MSFAARAEPMLAGAPVSRMTKQPAEVRHHIPMPPLMVVVVFPVSVVTAVVPMPVRTVECPHKMSSKTRERKRGSAI